MVVKWKGYEPGSPEALAAAKAYVPPKGIIKEAPDITVEEAKVSQAKATAEAKAKAYVPPKDIIEEAPAIPPPPAKPIPEPVEAPPKEKVVWKPPTKEMVEKYVPPKAVIKEAPDIRVVEKVVPVAVEVKEVPPPPPPSPEGEAAFRQLVEDGTIPKDATYKGYDEATGEVSYELPAEARKVLPVGFTGAVGEGEVRAETLFSQMIEAGEVPGGATLLSYDKNTGEFSYELPRAKVLPVGFKGIVAPGEVRPETLFSQMIELGDVPVGAILQSYDKKTGEFGYELPSEKVLPVGFIGAVAPGEVRAETLFSQMIEAGEVPKGAILQSYDKKTGEFSYQLPSEKVLPIGFIGAVAPGEVRPETLFSQMIELGEVPKGATLTSYDKKTGEFEYELPPEEKPLVGKVGVTFIGDKRIEFEVSPEVETTLNTVAGYLRMFGGAADIKTGTTLEEQLAYTGELPVIGVIPEELRASVLRMGNMMSLFATDIKSKPTDPLKFIPEVLYTAGTFLPVVGTALTWGKSSWTIRGINLAIDAAIMFPWMRIAVRSAAKAIQKAKDPSKYAIQQLLAAERQATKGMAEVIQKTYGKEAAQSFIKVNKAQADYSGKLFTMMRAEGKKATRAVGKIDKAIELATKQLGTANKAKNWALVRKLEKSITNLKNQRAKIDPATVARTKTAEAASQLEVATQSYRDALKKAGVGIDDTLVLASLDEMPKMLIKNTEVAVRETVARSTTSDKALLKALGKAEAKLSQLQGVKATTDARIKLAYDNWRRIGRYDTPEHRVWAQAVEEGKALDKKVANALYEQAMAQSRLERAKAHLASDIFKSLEAKKAELAKARAQLKSAEALEARGGAPATALRSKVKKLQAEVFKLEDDYLKAIKGLEVEIRVKADPVKGYYAEAEGGIFGGRSRVAVAAPPTTEVSPLLAQAMKLAGRKPAVPAGAGARAPAVRPPLVDAVATTTLISVKAAWKLGEDEFARVAPMVREAVVTEIAPLIKTIVTPVEAETMTPDAIHAIEKAVKVATVEAIKTAAEGKTAAEIATEAKAKVEELVKTAIAPATKIAVLQKVTPIVKTATKIAAITRTKIGIAKPKPLKGRIRLPLWGKESEIVKPKGQPIPAGSIAWKKGLFWRYIPPPWKQDKPITLKPGVVPRGADISGGNSPYTTIQMIGRSRKAVVPEHISVDEGVVDIFISDKGRKIEFRGGGLETDVGKRLPSPTKGMSVGELVPEVDFGAPMPMQEIRRPVKKKPPKKRLTHYERMTTLKGFNLYTGRGV